ncbi:MAG: Hsp20/alpha crystallin family protein [Planctomycetaceae bacterium]
MNSTLTKREPTTPRRWFERGPMGTLRNEVDELFESFFGTPAMASASELMIPSIDVAETDDAIEVTTDLPGIRAEDVDIEIRNDTLTISGQTSESKETDEGNGRRYHRIERRVGRFSRSVRLPCGVQQDKIDAQLKDGVLTVKMPKAEEAKSRKITVKG